MWEKRASWSGLGERSLLLGEAYASQLYQLRHLPQKSKVGVGNLATFLLSVIATNSTSDFVCDEEIAMLTLYTYNRYGL
jgi:hypothetical protein